MPSFGGLHALGKAHNRVEGLVQHVNCEHEQGPKQNMVEHSLAHVLVVDLAPGVVCVELRSNTNNLTAD